MGVPRKLTRAARAEKANDQILKELWAVVLRGGFIKHGLRGKEPHIESRPNYRDVGLTLAVESCPFIIHSGRSFPLSGDKDESHLPAGEASHRCQSSGASPPRGSTVGEIQNKNRTRCGFRPFV